MRRIIAIAMLAACGCGLTPTSLVNEYTRTVCCEEGFYVSLKYTNGSTAAIACSRTPPKATGATGKVRR